MINCATGDSFNCTIVFGRNGGWYPAATGKEYMKKIESVLVDRARQMRKEPTQEEKRMWYMLLQGMKPRFLRQRVIGNYIVDFYCPTLKMVIEIDGEQHYLEENQEYENKRTKYIEGLGIKILRFYNSDINRKIRDVEKTVVGACEERVKELGLDIEITLK